MGEGGATNEPEVKFESHTNTAPLCAESLRPESGILGTVCALRTFKAKHPQGQKHSYSYCGGGSARNRSDKPGRPLLGSPGSLGHGTHGAVGRNRRRRCAGPGGTGTENVQSGQVPPGKGRGHRLRPCLSYNNYRLFYVPSQESIGESTSEHLVHLPRHGTDPAARSYRQVSALCRMQLACTRAGTLRTTVRPCRVTLTLWGCPLAMFLLSASMLKGSLVPPRL